MPWVACGSRRCSPAGAAAIAGDPDLPPDELARARAHDPRAWIAWDALIEAAVKLVAAMRVAAPERARGAGLRPRRPGAGGRRGPRPVAWAAPLAHAPLSGFAAAAKEAAQGARADRRRARRRLASRPWSRRCGSGRAAARCSITSTWRARTRCGATSGSRADPDRRAHDARHRRVRPSAPARRSSPSTTSATSIRARCARPHSLRERGLGYSPAAILEARARRSPTTRSSTAAASRTIRTWWPSWPEAASCSATRRRRSAACAIRSSSSGFSPSRGFAVPRHPRRHRSLPDAAAGGSSKPMRGGGGQGVRPWAGQPPTPSQILQELRRRREAGRLSFVSRRPAKRRPRMDRAAPRPAELPVRRQPHAARGGAAAREEVGAIADALTREYGLRRPERLRLRPAPRAVPWCWRSTRGTARPWS